MSENLIKAASQAGLTKQQQAQIDGLSKLLKSHKNLLALPTNQAQQKFGTLTQDQQNAHLAMFGSNEDPTVVQKRGAFGTAAHYVTDPIKKGIGGVFAGLNEVSDFMTRLYRTGAIAVDQNIDLAKAFDVANDKGDQVFSPDRIASAEQRYGKDVVGVAVKVASGQSLDKILAEGSELEKQIAAAAAQKQNAFAKNGIDFLFEDALFEVNKAKYSPGRFVANLLPGPLEDSKLLYKGISGFADASYRIFADPLLILGKAKKSYDAANYALFKIVKSPEKVDEVFTRPAIVNFFDSYGAELSKLSKARVSDDIKAGVEASTNLRRLAPEFGPSAVDEFIKAGVKDADTAKNYLSNIVDVKAILGGQSGRKTPLIPRLDLRRRTRVGFLTTTDRIFNLDKVGQKLVQSLYGTAPVYEDVLTGITTRAEDIAKVEAPAGILKTGKFRDGSVRLSFNQIHGKIDRFARKFTVIPYFKNGFFDPDSSDAVKQVYQLARLANTRYHSKIITEAFSAGTEGQRRQIFTGLWNTVAEIRGVSKSATGKSYMDEFAGKGAPKIYAPVVLVDDVDELGNVIGKKEFNPASFDGQQLAIFDYQLAPALAVPSVMDLDRLSARSGLIGRTVGISHKNWAEDMTSAWTLGTLAGPKFPVRNAGEDLMIHLAIGDSPWGIVKGRFLSTRLRSASKEGNLGFINKLIKKNQIDDFQRRIKEAADAGDVNAVRTIQAEAILESKLITKLDPEAQQIVSDIAKYGNLKNTLADISEGGKNALRGTDQYVNATSDVSKFGEMGALDVDGIKYQEAYGVGFTEFNPAASTQAMVSWLVTIGIVSKDDLGRIAVANLKDRKIAISEIKKYLEALPKKNKDRFQLYSVPGETVDSHALRVYEATKNVFSKSDGSLNEELLSKVRFADKDGNIKVSASSLSIDDLPKTRIDAPRYISGPTLIPVTENDRFVAGLSSKAWDYMGEANARFSREPIVLDAMIKISKDMKSSGFDERIISQFTAGKTGDDLIKATEDAKRHLVSITEDLAKERVLAFVDNPAVRSQLAMTVRNFARFYRATEDFYRRIYRTVRYNPEALSRASLTYEGVSHSGFIQTDDNGDQYFFYPGLTPVYKVMNKVFKAFGIEEAFQAPMPVEFSGKIKMITPSANPDSLFPTFAGPLAAFPLKALVNIVPQFQEIETILAGPYSEDQPMINALLPAHVNRLLAALNTDERNSQYASAARKAATYLEATGNGLKPNIDPNTQQEIPPSPGDLAAYQDKLQASSLTVLGVRFLFGFVAPASPQVTLKSDMAKWVRDNRNTSYKQAFNNLVVQYKSNGIDNPYDKATEEWIRLFPDQMPYTITESESNVVAMVSSVEQAGNWIEQNPDLLSKYPEGASFLIPSAGDFDFNAYKLLFREDIKRNKTLSDFLRQASTAKDEQFFYEQRDLYEAQLAITTSTSAKGALRQNWEDWSRQFKGARPLLQEELGSNADRAIQRQTAYQDLKNMLSDPIVTTQPKTRSILKQMSLEYDYYLNTKNSIVGSGRREQILKDSLRENIKARLQQIASGNSNAVVAYNSLFAKLIGD